MKKLFIPIVLLLMMTGCSGNIKGNIGGDTFGHAGGR